MNLESPSGNCTSLGKHENRVTQKWWPGGTTWWRQNVAQNKKQLKTMGYHRFKSICFLGYTGIPVYPDNKILATLVRLFYIYIYIGYVISTCFLQGKISNWQILQNAPWESHLQRLETDGRWWLPSGFPGRCDQLQQCHQRPLRGWCEGSAVGSTDLGGDGGAAGIPWKMPSGEPLWQKKKHGKTKKNWMKTINKWHLIMRSCWFDMILPSKVWLHSKENMKPER